MGGLFDPANSGPVGGVSFLITIAGFALTALGLRLTYVQAREAKRAADSAETSADTATEAVTSFRFKLDHYSAYRDISDAEFAMEACKRHLQGEPAWSDASESYEIARRALIRSLQLKDELPQEVAEGLRKISDHIRSFCNRIDAAKAGKQSYPDAAKVTSAIRNNYEILASAKAFLEKDLV